MATSTGYNGKTVTRDSEVSAQHATTEREAMWGEIPGEIIAFDPATQKAVVQPLYKPKHNGASITLPPLEEVPVRFDRCEHGGMTYPLVPGDRVLLRPMMRNTEKFHLEDNFEATDARSFSLSDMEAYIDGGEPVEVDPILDFDPLNSHWRFNDLGVFGFRASIDGKILVEMQGGELMQLLITGFSALASEPTLNNNAAYAAIAAALTASRIN